eukprot:CAMPEP_0194680260 /NCGR_PEP_ID=MMETSP0295-20121207/11324_1 /TAXON_ID=39354 /ORGANISM="Heterosigma akashiwo, Strain CCMP2393" /LENGTH=103 /DNA_ID=CAMNT_0039565905 /DNA_START=484 /DNA_END=792 /DNA_ORIENTATION=-
MNERQGGVGWVQDAAHKLLLRVAVRCLFPQEAFPWHHIRGSVSIAVHVLDKGGIPVAAGKAQGAPVAVEVGVDQDEERVRRAVGRHRPEPPGAARQPHQRPLQ